MSQSRLTKFATATAMNFSSTLDLERREEFATHVADKYGFEEPRIVLSVTHPELSKAPLSERCKKLGYTEEQYVVLTAQKGFQDFLNDFERTLDTSLKFQTLQKLSKAVEQDRYNYDKDGNETSENFDVEKIVFQASKAEKASKQPQVSINFWEMANQRRRSRSADQAIEVQTTPALPEST